MKNESRRRCAKKGKVTGTMGRQRKDTRDVGQSGSQHGKITVHRPGLVNANLVLEALSGASGSNSGRNVIEIQVQRPRLVNVNLILEILSGTW